MHICCKVKPFTVFSPYMLRLLTVIGKLTGFYCSIYCRIWGSETRYIIV